MLFAVLSSRCGFPSNEPVCLAGKRFAPSVSYFLNGGKNLRWHSRHGVLLICANRSIPSHFRSSALSIMSYYAFRPAGLRADINSYSDFPSLSGGPRASSQQQQQQPAQQTQAQQPQATINSTPNSTSWNSNAIRQPSTIQQRPQSSQQSQQRAPSAALSQHSIDQYDTSRILPSSQPPLGERAAGGDDFPPLGGHTNGDNATSQAHTQSNGFASSAGFASPAVQSARANSQQHQDLPIREASGSLPQQQQQRQTNAAQTNSSLTSTLPQHPAPPQSQPRTKKYADMTEIEKWGLQGLIAAFESRKQSDTNNGGGVDETLPPAMRSAVIMGHDLNSLGMDLDSPDPLYPTFTPFQAIGASGSTTLDFHERLVVPAFELPSAYTVTNVPPLSSRMAAFSDGTLPSFPLIPTSRIASLPTKALRH